MLMYYPGTVKDLVWKQGQDPDQVPRFAILINFDEYDGPAVAIDPDMHRKLVPIFVSTRDWSRGSTICKRT